MIVAGPRAAFVRSPKFMRMRACATEPRTASTRYGSRSGPCHDEPGPVGPAAEEPAAPAPTPGPPTVSMALPTKHCVKKLSAGLDSVRSLIFGSHLGTHNHIIMMTQHFAQHEHDVDKASLERQDRQNFLGPVKLSGVKVSACLEDMQNGGQAVR